MRLSLWISLVGCALGLPGSDLAARDFHECVVTYGDFNTVNHIAGSMSHVYFATTSGVTRYDKMQDRWMDPLPHHGLDDDDIQRVWVDVFDQRLLARTSAGLFEYESMRSRWSPVAELPAMETSGRHTGAPSALFPPDRYTYSPEGYLVSPLGQYYYFTDVYDDESGRLWLGTWGMGAATCRTMSSIMELLPFGLLQSQVGAIIREGEELMVAGPILSDSRTGISILDLDNNSFRYFESGLESSFPGADINCLAVLGDRLYAGTPVGLLCLDMETGRAEDWYSARDDLSDNNVLSLAAVGDSLFVGTERGLSVVTFGRDTARYVRPDEFLNLTIYDIEPVDRQVWIGTSQGAYRLQVPSGKLDRFSDPELLITGDVLDIDAVGSDLWMLSTEGALRLNRETGDYRTFWHVAGTRAVTSLAADDEVLAVGSYNGLSLTYHAKERPRTTEFTSEDGLPSDRILELFADGEYLWVGSDRGLTRVAWREL